VGGCPRIISIITIYGQALSDPGGWELPSLFSLLNALLNSHLNAHLNALSEHVEEQQEELATSVIEQVRKLAMRQA